MIGLLMKTAEPRSRTRGAARRLAGAGLAAALRDSRARLRALIGDLSDAQWRPPYQPGVNPVAWEAAHVAWFAEFWTLRGPHRVNTDGLVCAARPARHAGPDEHLDSARLAHAQRWTTPLPERERVHAMLDAQLDATLAVLDRLPGDGDEALYFHRLSLFHEDMHAEAFVWLRAALGYAAPAGAQLPRLSANERLAVPGGDAFIGWPPGEPGFAFDNERRGHAVALRGFEIDARPVGAGEFAAFVDAGGYDRAELWPGEAGAWRASARCAHPQRWRREAGGWQVRWFDRWQPLSADEPVIHVNAFEAEAYARWAGRRLPTAAEWEHAAATHGAMAWGHGVWEWTADAFAPYAGFEPGPYKDYSAPWFGTHRELRGGSFATHERMHHARYRNYFEPQRADVFAGFRTAALT